MQHRQDDLKPENRMLLLFAYLKENAYVYFLYSKICEPSYAKTIDWSKWHVFWADERVVPRNHEDSNYKLAKDGLLSKVPYLFLSPLKHFMQLIFHQVL